MLWKVRRPLAHSFRASSTRTEWKLTQVQMTMEKGHSDQLRFHTSMAPVFEAIHQSQLAKARVQASTSADVLAQNTYLEFGDIFHTSKSLVGPDCCPTLILNALTIID